MTLSQASAVPITNKDAIETITLKNLIALDLVEKNEYILKAFKLLDDSKSKISLGTAKSKEEVESLIEKSQKELAEQQEELKILKQSLIQEKNQDNELINKLSTEFTNDEILIDDTDELIKKFEIENGVKIVSHESDVNYKQFKVDLNINASTKPQHKEDPIQPEESGDVEMEE